MTKLKALKDLSRKQLRALIAILVAVCVVVPSVVFVSIHGKADDVAPHLNDGGIRYTDSNVVDIEGIHLDKTVEQLDDDTYNVKLAAYAEANKIKQPITDIVMSLDVSKRMETTLYHRNKKNLNTHTQFTKVSLSDLSYNNMYDYNHPGNEDAFPGAGTWTNTYENRKYVLDPNTPGVYVYLAEAYKGLSLNFIGGEQGQKYQFDFTDSLGNQYTSGVIQNKLFFYDVDSITFYLKDPDNATPGAVESYTIGDIYTRPTSDTSSLNITLLDYAGTGSINELNRGDYYDKVFDVDPDDDWYHQDREEIVTYNDTSLVIADDNGNFIPVTMEVHRIGTYIIKRHYTNLAHTKWEDSDTGEVTYRNLEYIYYTDGDTYKVVQGNSEYGADYGVFQGFKTYKYLNINDIEGSSLPEGTPVDEDTGNVLDGNGKPILIVDHSKSIESKSLYTTSTGEDVTRIQAMKEASEKFIIQLHTDAFKKNPDLREPNARLSVITYGVDANVMCDLPDVNLSNEVESNLIIDKIYALSPSDRYASQLDEAMTAAKAQFDDYSTEGNTKQKDNDDGDENKKISVLFSSGVPSKETYKIVLYYPWRVADTDAERELTQSVADSAISTANAMKRDLGVLSYTVGLYNGATDEDSEKQGYSFSYGAQIIHQNVYHNGDIGDIWGSTDFANFIQNLKGGEVADVDVPATNRVMDYISSNFSDVENLGLQKKSNWNPRNYWLTAGGTGYKILSKPSPTAEDHFFAIDYKAYEDGDENVSDHIDEKMQDVFDQIASSVEIPSTTLGPEDLLIDYITDSFDIINTTESPVKAYTQTPTDRTNPEATTTTWRTISTLNPVVDGNKVSVDGFDYMAHNMLNSEENGAQRLVLDFNIKRKDGLIGGNNIPTNTSMAGVYDLSYETDTQGNVIYNEGKPVVHNTVLDEAFRIPHVDLALKTGLAAANDDSIYLGSTVKLEDLIDTVQTNGFNNRFVKIEYEVWDGNTKINTYVIQPGSAVGEWETKVASNEEGTTVNNLDKQYPVLDETTEYTIKMIVHPEVRTGTLVETPMKDSEGNDPTATVYVFTPHVDVRNDTITVAKDYDLTDIPSAVTWETKTAGAEGTLLEDEQLAAAEALLPTEIDDTTGESHRIYPDTSITIITTDAGEQEVTDSNVDAYPISEERHFKVSEITVEPLPFTFEAWQPVRYADEYDDQGNVTSSHTEDEYVTHYVNITLEDDEGTVITDNCHTWDPVSATYTNGTASYNNIDDDRKTGDFTIFFGHFFNMSIDKHFTGNYANLQKVTITVTPVVNNNPVTADAQSVVFEKSDFNATTYEANAPKTIGQLKANMTYVITETFDAGDSEKAKYNVLFTVDENGTSVGDADEDNANGKFLLNKADNDKTVSVLVNNEAKDIPVTGISESDESFTPMIILGVLAVMAGAGGVYFVYRKNGADA